MYLDTSWQDYNLSPSSQIVVSKIGQWDNSSDISNSAELTQEKSRKKKWTFISLLSLWLRKIRQNIMQLSEF